jgi:hypothetical protein
MRVTSDLFVSALLRRLFSEGGFGAVVRRGATEAGAVFVVVRDRMGGAQLYGPAPQTAYGEAVTGRQFSELGAAMGEEALEARLAREAKFDPDIWVVDVEPGSTPVAELLEITKP